MLEENSNSSHDGLKNLSLEPQESLNARRL